MFKIQKKKEKEMTFLLKLLYKLNKTVIILRKKLSLSNNSSEIVKKRFKLLT